jgi:hypothetical protein
MRDVSSTLLLAGAGLAALGVVTACSGDSTDGSGGAGGSTTTTSSSTSGGSSCADCTEDQTCQTCNSVVEITHACITNATVGPDQFACEWLACQQGTEVCVSITPAGDGCDGAECRDLPDECTNTPTCECITQHISASCAVDAEGNATLHCMSGMC